MHAYCNNVISIDDKKIDEPIDLSMMGSALVVHMKIKYNIGTIVHIILTINNGTEKKIH